MKNIIKLTECDLHRLIRESIAMVLSESASSLLFHYCSIESLLKMLEGDKLYLSDGEQEFNGDGMYYMSFTRNRNSVQGYPYMNSYYSLGGGTRHNGGSDFLFCRLTLDGSRMNSVNNFKVGGKRHNFSIKPFDYLYNEFGGVNGRVDAYYSDNDEEYYHQPFSQAEDRLISTSSYIPSMSKYLLSVDVYINVEKLANKLYDIDFMYLYRQVCLLKSLCEKYDINVYSKQHAFDLGKKSYIDKKLVSKVYNIFNELYEDWQNRCLKNLSYYSSQLRDLCRK